MCLIITEFYIIEHDILFLSKILLEIDAINGETYLLAANVIMSISRI